jgi:hypothetical protein
MISCMLCDTKGHLTYSYQFLMFESANVLYSLAAETKREREREGTELRTNKTVGSVVARVASRFLLICHSEYSSSVELVGSESVAGASDKHGTHQDDRSAESDSGREAVLADESSCDGSPG